MDTRNWESLNTIRFPVRTLFDVEWIDIDQVDSPLDNLREQGFSNGAARFARGKESGLEKENCILPVRMVAS